MTSLNLYRRTRWKVTLALVFALALAAFSLKAQRRAAHKLRAIALLELNTDHKGVKTARLTPIVILDEGNFHDASIYKAAPEPMALGTGVVYEAQKDGLPVGFVTISTAAKDRIWTALGKWQAESDKPKPKASATPTPGSSDDRPRLRRPASSDGVGAGAATPQASPSATPAATPESRSSDDRPVLHRPASEPSPSATVSPTPAGNPAVTPEAQSESSDPNRPTLRYGKPKATPEHAQNAQQSATPSGSSSPAPTPTTAAARAAKPSGTTELMVAVSDTEPVDSRPFKFTWKPGEEAPIAAKLRHQAAQRLSQDGHATVNERDLKNVVIRSFDLDLTNDAIIVLTAELPAGSPSAPKTASKTPTGARKTSTPEAAPSTQLTRYITLISRVDLDGNPQVLAASLTDSSRLDIAPRLEFIDAVDVDGDGVGELLFREYDFDNQGFVIYSVRRGVVNKVFEGASQALKPAS